VTQLAMQGVACPSCGASAGRPGHRGGRGQRIACVKRRGLAEALIGWREGGPSDGDRRRAHWRRNWIAIDPHPRRFPTTHLPIDDISGSPGCKISACARSNWATGTTPTDETEGERKR
jgi:hypothetical protein